ncbi:MAG: hypothetical protein ABIQ55_05545 [Gemmatimonadaceae bacterium]
MWRDEVRAFSIATRAATWTEMLGNLRGEGHPALWYALLRLSFEITHSKLVLPILSLSIAAFAAYLILRYSPFPLWLRLLSVFGSLLGYEFSVVARNYGIGIMLILVASVLFKSRDRHYWQLGAVLVLAANSSVHAAIASVMIGLLWSADLLKVASRREAEWKALLVGLAIVLVGTVIGIWTAKPSIEMAYSVALQHLGIGQVISSILVDPGVGLKGVFVANIAASGELPWSRIGIDPVLASRLIVDLSLLAVAFALLPARRYLAVFLTSILAFEVLFHGVYPGAIRHQGILTFLILALCWIAIRDHPGATAGSFAKRVSYGLLPMMFMQSLALPIVARRHLMHRESSSKAFAGLILSTPYLRDAILMSEPDYLMEPLPYYVQNPIYMPRQHEYDYRVYFDLGSRHSPDLTLGALINAADSVGCTERKPVLLAVGYPNFLSKSAGDVPGAFHAAHFVWSPEEHARLTARARLLRSFDGATTDENYEVFELLPLNPAVCTGATQVSH